MLGKLIPDSFFLSDDVYDCDAEKFSSKIKHCLRGIQPKISPGNAKVESNDEAHGFRADSEIG